MLSILFTVLKVIGIAILIILGLILFILLLVLFVPVRYHGKGSYLDGVFAAKLRATWLLHIVSVRGEYLSKQTLHIYMKIFGITVYDNLKATAPKIKNKKVKSTKTKTKSAGEIQAASSENNDQEADLTKDPFSEEPIVEDGEVISGKSYPCAMPEIIAGDDLQEELPDGNGEKTGIFQKIKNFLINFVNFFKNLKFTFDRVCDTMVRIKNNIKYYFKVLQLDSTKRAFATCQKQLGSVLSKVLPRKFRINLHLGFDDPAVMGEILAVWGMFYPLHQGNIDIQPEFEQVVTEGDFFLQGHVNVFVFARAACILFFDKDIKRLIKHLKRSKV